MLFSLSVSLVKLCVLWLGCLPKSGPGHLIPGSYTCWWELPDQEFSWLICLQLSGMEGYWGSGSASASCPLHLAAIFPCSAEDLTRAGTMMWPSQPSESQFRQSELELLHLCSSVLAAESS